MSFFLMVALPFIMGLIANGASHEVFKDPHLYEIAQQIYEKTGARFNKKYRDIGGGEYHNFVARQENLERLLRSMLAFKPIDRDTLNARAFDGSITPDEVVQDFLVMFEDELEADHRLVDYRGKREHYILTKSMLEKVEQLRFRISKFEDVDTFLGSGKMQPYTLQKTINDTGKIISCLKERDIVVMDSFRGFGKTQTLVEVVSRVKDCNQFEKVLIMRHGVRNILDALQTELYPGTRYLIVIDDVDLCIGECIELLRFIRESKDNCKVLVSSQTYMVPTVRAAITRAECLAPEYISLNEWCKDDFIELLRKASFVEKYPDEDAIATKYPSPSVITWIAKADKDSTKTIKEMFERSYELMKNDSRKILTGIVSERDCDRLIFSLSCTIPVHITTAFEKLIQQVIGISEQVLHDSINRLVDGGVLRKVGYGYRFLPDIKGDIYLAYSNSYFEREFSFWIENLQSEVLANIKYASHIKTIDLDMRLNSIIEEWITAETYYEQADNLRRAHNIVDLAPDHIMDLISCYFEYAKEAGGEYGLTTDNFGPLLLKLGAYPTYKTAVLDIIRELEAHKLDGTYDNYKVKGLVSSLFSPAEASVSEVNSCLDVLEKWPLDQKEVLRIFQYALSEILKGSHEVTTATPNSIQIGQVLLDVTEDLLLLRRRCIKMIENTLDANYQYETVEAIESILKSFGRMGWGIGPRQTPLAEEIALEREQLIDIIGKKFLSSVSISCNVVLERVLLNWWALQVHGCEKIEEYLSAFERSARYLFVKYHVDADYRIVAFEDIRAIAPTADRWGWFVKDVMYNEDRLSHDFSRIAEALCREILTTDQFATFIRDSVSAIDPLGFCWSIPPILDEWCKLNPALFREYLGSAFYYETFGVFRAGVLRSVARLGEGCDRSVIDSLLESSSVLSSEEIECLLTLVAHKSLPDDYVTSVLRRIIGEGTFDYPGVIIHRLYFIFKERDLEPLVDALIQVLKTYPFDRSLLEMLNFILKQFAERLTRATYFCNLKELVVEGLLTVKRFDYHENSILETIIENRSQALEFIEKRLRKNDYFRVPSDGFLFLRKFIVDADGYSELLTLLARLSDEGLIDTYRKKVILRPLFSVKDEPTLIDLLSSYIEVNDLQHLAGVLNALRLNANTLKPFMQGIVHLNNHSMGREAEEILKSHMYPSMAWSRRIGEHSPEIVGRIELFKELYNMLPHGKLRLVVKSCINELENDLTREMTRDEDILNHR